MDPISRFFRTLWMRITERRRGPLGPHDVGRVPARVWLTDIDELGHVNNGVYLSQLDHPRFDLLRRAGLWDKIISQGIYPVVGMQTITYRKSLRFGQRYTIESRVVGYDERAVLIEQRYVVKGEIYADAYVLGRFLRRSGGTVSIAELSELTGIDAA
ncbi:MAG: acyl-CoA thioesterase, partial [Leifsonia sp.]